MRDDGRNSTDATTAVREATGTTEVAVVISSLAATYAGVCPWLPCPVCADPFVY